MENEAWSHIASGNTQLSAHIRTRAWMNAKAPTVFTVDDDRGLLRLIDRALQREGIGTISASSGTEARAWLAEHRPELMLLDLKLEDTDGQTLVEQLAATGRCPPFIIITGQGDERVAVEMMKRGARDYLVKDRDFLEFVPAVVKRALDQVEKERRLAAAEEQVQVARAEHRRLEKEILEISDQERRRLGQDLHDGLCQHLAGIELMSQVLGQKLGKRSKADAARAHEIARHVRDAISQTRALARGLSPVTLESEGLASALLELAASTEKIFGVSCRVECPPPPPVPGPAVATHLYRIAQEAVSNALKHGKASKIVFRLISVNKRTVLEIIDNGTGFPEPMPEQKGLGLRFMRYRAGMIGGELSFAKKPGGGTVVSCSLEPSAK
jgi:signal transduction histidine kinase